MSRRLTLFVYPRHFTTATGYTKMEIKENNIALLRQKIEEKSGRQMLTPKDFDYLSDCVFEECRQKISPTTLKRLWGYLSEVATPRISTLNILSQFVGCQDWESFCRQMQPFLRNFAPDTKNGT